MANLDSNLVSVEWGLLGAFGVAISLLIPNAEKLRRDYLRGGWRDELENARRWRRIVLSASAGVLVVVFGLSLVGLDLAHGLSWHEAVLLWLPVLAQFAFMTMVILLVPSSRPGISVFPEPDEGALLQRRVRIFLENRSREDLTMTWLDPHAGPSLPLDHQLQTLAAGAKVDVDTRLQHELVVTTQDGTNVGEYKVTKNTPSKIVITAESISERRRRTRSKRSS